ncbi:hypothetical protein BDV12DRAFT_181033 [Aspergillus spectabilis]
MMFNIRNIFHRKRPFTMAETTSTTGTQKESPSMFLTRLPVEIRLRIYGYVFGPGTVHFFQEKEYMFCILCQTPSAHPTHSCQSVVKAGRAIYRFGMAMDNISEFGWGDPYIPPGVVSTGDIALLRVCRQVYSEALPVLYSSVTFEVEDRKTWIRFCRWLGDGKVALVKSLRVNGREVRLDAGYSQDESSKLNLQPWYSGARYVRSSRS